MWFIHNTVRVFTEIQSFYTNRCGSSNVPSPYSSNHFCVFLVLLLVPTVPQL